MDDGRLLPSRLQKRVAASIQHIVLSLLREEKGIIVSLGTLA